MPAYDDPRLKLPPSGAGIAMQVNAGVVSLRKAPEPDGEQASQMLHGEEVILHHEAGEFGLVQSRHDNYTGWALMEALSAPVLVPTHRVSVLRAYVYPSPSIKASPRFPVSLGARLASTGIREGRFVQCERSGWVIADQLSPIDSFDDDPADIALRYLHTPYLWGARESLGIDCSGLIQQAFGACGVQAPRDSDMQAAWLGDPVAEWTEAGALQRNDLIFWKGHVGLMLDSSRVIHANGHHMAVAAEPLREAIDRIEPLYGRPTQARRLNIPFARDRKVPVWMQKT
jgi:cell wall-associated NlpC family hydrolase